ncbi:MAG: hypothetical protein M1821_007825, partial [Bathelium mastoideum]
FVRETSTYQLEKLNVVFNEPLQRHWNYAFYELSYYLQRILHPRKTYHEEDKPDFLKFVGERYGIARKRSISVPGEPRQPSHPSERSPSGHEAEIRSID